MHVSIFIINTMAVYCVASIIYLLITFGNQNKPFYKSLTRRQRLVLNKSKKKRKNIFILGCLIAIALLFYLNPFSHDKLVNGGGQTHQFRYMTPDPVPVPVPVPMGGQSYSNRPY